MYVIYVKSYFIQKFSSICHLQTHTGERLNSKQWFSYNLCLKVFSSKASLNHLRIHTGEKSYICGFKFRQYLKCHHKTHEEKSFIYDACQKSYHFYYVLKSHVQTHCGEKLFSCGICQKAFVRKGGLKNHLWSHTGEKPYSSIELEKSYTRVAWTNLNY